MPIVQYSEDKKTFNVALALSDGGWNVQLAQLPDVRDLRLTDRNDPAHHVTVSHITHERFFNMYFVYYLEGGWQCLDHAIEQFKTTSVDQRRREGNV